jgi:S1-C subfamily serine protease
LTNIITTTALANSPREIAKRVIPSVVLLVMEDGNGKQIATGSGFFVSDGVIATNFHVIKGATQAYAKLAVAQDWRIREVRFYAT